LLARHGNRERRGGPDAGRGLACGEAERHQAV